MEVIRLLAEALFAVVIILSLLVFILRLIVGVEREVYLVEGQEKTINLGGGATISVTLRWMNAQSVYLGVAFARGDGQWRYDDKFEVVTEDPTDFLIFPTPRFPYQNHEWRVYGTRKGDRVYLALGKKGGWKPTFFGGPKFT